MENETNKFQMPKHQAALDPGNVAATAQNILEKGNEVYGKAEQVVGEAYDKTSQKVKETFEKAKSFTDENPSKSIFIALGIGVGIGLLLSASSSNRSRTGRIAQPVINALSDIAHEIFH